MLPQYPSYYNGQDPSKQITVMRNYIISLKDELEQALADIKYENLDPALRKKFDAIDNTLANLKNATRTIEEDIKVNYDTEADIDAVYAKISDLEDVADDVEDIDDRVTALENDHVTDDRVTAIENALGEAEGDIDDLEAIDAGTRLTALESDALTASNFNTKMATADIETGTVKATSFKIGNDTFTNITVTIDGTQYSLLGF